MSALPDFSSRPQRPASLVDRVLVGAAAVVLALSLHAAWAAQRELSVVTSATTRLREHVAAEASRYQALRGRLGSPAGAAATPWALTLDSPPSRVLGDLAAALPPDVRLRSAALRYGSEVLLDVDVVARDAGAYDRFLEGLAGSARFAGVVPGGEGRDGEVRSSLAARYVDGLGR